MHEDATTEEIRVVIAANLRQLRNTSGLTQAQLAEAAHIEINTYQRYEYGNINIPMSKAVRLTGALGCSLEELLAPDGARPGPRNLREWFWERLRGLRRTPPRPRPAALPPKKP